jgi:DNA-binding GntR family transcriptional regulator
MDTIGGLARLTVAQPLRDRAYDAIKEAILTLSLKPGEPLVERNLATRLGISKTPIRGALVRLEREGLVTMAPFKGTIVAHIYKDDIREIFELREALESLAARRAASMLTEDDLREGERALDIADEAFRAGRYAECSRIGHGIHDILIKRAGNKRLRAIVRNLDDHLQRYRLVSAQIPGRLARSNQEHRDLLAALRARDVLLAERLMREHLQGVLDDLMTQDDVAPSENPDSLPVIT